MQAQKGGHDGGADVDAPTARSLRDDDASQHATEAPTLPPRDAGRANQDTNALELATSILNSQEHAFVVLDNSLRVVSANAAFFAAFGGRSEDTVGKLIFDLADRQWDLRALRENLLGLVESETPFDPLEIEYQGIGPQLSRRLSLNARRVQRGGSDSELLLLSIMDVTESARLKSLLADQSEVLELATAGAPLIQLLKLVATSARHYCGPQSRATLFLLETEGRHLRYAAGAGMDAAYVKAIDHFRIGPDQPSCGMAAYSGLTEVVPDVAVNDAWAPFLALAEEHEIRACWSHPIRTAGGRILGTIAVYHRTPRTTSPADLDALRLLGHTAALVLEAHDGVEKRRHVEQALNVSETRFRRLFETAKDGILILDADTGIITDANAFMAALVGMTPADLIGKELFEVGMFKDVAENKEAFRQLQQTGYLRHDHLPVSNRAGERVEVEFIANVYKEGSRLVAQCNVRDIGDRRRLEQQVAQQTETLAAQSRGKDEFLAMLSHELRNPLAPIRSAVHLLRLQETSSNPIQRQAREIIERQVANLTKMVSDLLEVSRVLSGRIRLDLQPVDLRQIAEHALQTALPLLDQRRHGVSINLAPVAVWALVDPTRMEEVLVNLLTNAAKYTSDGGRIEVVCEPSGPEVSPPMAVLRVRDNGVGIDNELLPRIFDLFTQADRSLDRAVGGLGIGLSLAHRLVQMHGGTIAAKSEGPGRGSEFTVTLPMVVAPQDLVAEGPMSLSPPDGADDADAGKLRVLVVDDNADFVTMLAAILRHKGYHVRSARTGPDAVALATRWNPEILLLDIGLPGLDGYEVARRVRSAHPPDGSPRMKLIALTGYGQQSDIILAMEAGFDHHMVKPCDLEELQRLIAIPSKK
jgi:PAS domain S-box-containing protein